jgi:hypothetical protein
MNYISLIGTQSMGVLNPLLALVEQDRKPDKIYLLPTRMTRGKADTMKQFLVLELFSEQQIQIVPISNTLAPDDNGPAAQQAVGDILSRDAEGPIFNIAGGMNFQIAACVQSISPKRCTFIYPELAKVSVILVENDEIVSSESLPLPSPVDVFALQGIQVEKLKSKSADHIFLEQFFKNNRFDLPADALKNVIIRNVQSGHEVNFDLVWNSGNHLNFLKGVTAGNKARSPKEYLKVVRAINTVATNREFFSELYDRKIGVLTDHALINERIQKESENKVTAFFLNRKSSPWMLKMALNDFFNDLPVSEKKVSEIEIDSVETGNKKSGNDLLVISLGTNIVPSLIALWSHNPKHVCFAYTPGNDLIDNFKKNIIAQKKILPVETVSFYPVSVTGTEILDIEISEDHEALVNITPGTKGHNTFLTLWAMKHGGRIFSLNNAAKTYQQIPEGASGVQKIPTIIPYLKLRGIRVKNYGADKGLIKQQEVQHERILDFLKMMDREGVPVTNFYQKTVTLKKAGAKSVYYHKKQEVRLSQSGKSNMTFSVRLNEWFEALTAYVLVKCGIRDVQVRFRSAWSKPVEEHLVEKFKTEKNFVPPFMSDVDVIATLDNNYYVISCKATKKHNADDFTAEASAFARLFGRFAIPMLCYLKYDGQPYNTYNGVYIFGYKTLCDTDKMKALLGTALADRRNTP